MVNPFYVEPLGGRDLGRDAVRGLQLGEMFQQREARDQAQEQVSGVRAEALDAFRRGDHRKMRELSIMYPELLEGAVEAMDFTGPGEQLTTGWTEAAFRYADKPQIVEAVTRQTIRDMQAQGVPTDNIERDYQRFFGPGAEYDPEMVRGITGFNLLALDPARYDAATDISDRARDAEYWASLPEGPMKTAVGRSLGFVDESGDALPPELLESYGEQAAVASAAYSAAGGGAQGLDAAQEAAERAVEEEQRLGVSGVLSQRFPEATPDEMLQLQRAVDDAPNVAEGLQAANTLREKQRVDKKGQQYIDRAAFVIERALANPELNDVLGSVEGRDDEELPWYASIIPRSDNEAQAISDIREAESILTADNLDLMSGVLSESDLKLIARLSAGGLNRVRGESAFIDDAGRLLASLKGIPAVKTDEEYKALPSGSQFVDLDDGLVYVKQ